MSHLSHAELSGTPLREEPEPVEANLDALISRFKAGYETYGNLREKVLSGENFSFIYELAGKNVQDFNLPPELWCAIVYAVSVPLLGYLADRS